MLSILSSAIILLFFFFNDTATTEIYTLSLHDALPISLHDIFDVALLDEDVDLDSYPEKELVWYLRSEEHTSELQSRFDLVCRLLLEKKKDKGEHKETTRV